MKLPALLIALSTLCLCSCDTHSKENNLILDVRKVINKAPHEVEIIMGKPDTTYIERIVGRGVFVQRYAKSDIEIQYWDNRSTDIIVHRPHGLPFNQNALKGFNLPYKKKHPSQYAKGAYMRWYNFDEFETIGLYNVQKDNAGRIQNFSVYFKAKS